jgi:CRISPR/Cas system-associated exonuclease Cas4 (RecB family)
MLTDDSCDERDIVIVTSKFSEYAPYYENLLKEYHMKGYNNVGKALSTYSTNKNILKNHNNFNIQAGYFSYSSTLSTTISNLEHLGLKYDTEYLEQTILENTFVKSEKIGILLIEANKILDLQNKVKHIIFIGSDITHFPPKESVNFLYTKEQSIKYFHTNNGFDSSQELYNKLKRLSENLYIVTANYSGKRELAQSIIIDKNINNIFDVSDIKSRNDILKNNKRIEEKDLEEYQNSIISPNFTKYDGNIEKEFNNGNKLSASAINTYVKCPLQYYFNNVLKLNESKDEQDGFDNMQRGNLIHLCFENFVKEIQTSKYDSILDNPKKLYDLMLNLSNEAYENEKIQKDIKEENINHKIDLALLQVGLDDIYSENKKELAKFVDYFINGNFEEFKNSNPEEEFILDSEFNIVDLYDKNRENKRFIKGYIDRLDNLTDEVNIIDYKSSLNSYTKKDFEFDDNNLKNYQLGIYMLYSHKQYSNNKEHNSQLLAFKKQGKNEISTISLDSSKYTFEYEDKLKRNIINIKNSINKGEFPFNNKDEKTCGYCSFKNICHQKVLSKGEF